MRSRRRTDAMYAALTTARAQDQLAPGADPGAAA